jgi:hypothetical protein
MILLVDVGELLRQSAALSSLACGVICIEKRWKKYGMVGATDKTAEWQMANRPPDGGLLVTVGCSTLASAALLGD